MRRRVLDRDSARGDDAPRERAQPPSHRCVVGASRGRDADAPVHDGRCRWRQSAEPGTSWRQLLLLGSTATAAEGRTQLGSAAGSSAAAAISCMAGGIPLAVPGETSEGATFAAGGGSFA